MKNEYLRTRSHKSNIPWIWVGFFLSLLAIIIIARSFSSTNISIDTDRPHLLVTPMDSASTVFISMSESSKTRITGTGGQPLYLGDTSVWVETGWAIIANTDIKLDLDKWTELAYIGHTSTWDTVKLIKWKVWVNQNWSTGHIEMKNLSVLIKEWSIVLLEQSNPVFSIVYAIRWDSIISTSIGEYTLKAWNRIMLSATELSNPWLQLSSQAGSIDEDIMKNPLFIRNNWKNLLANMSGSISNTGSINSDTGSIITNQVISFIEPIDWSLSIKTSIAIRWNIESKDIKKITLNDKEATISPVNSTFSYLDFPITAEVNNIVYKVYNTDGKEIHKWVITVYWSKEAIQNTNKLITNNSPISSKDFSIISPATNPFFTTDRFMKVQWAVPKNTVSYILVNDYRLQKYISGSSNWYYYANMDNETMRDGINSYKIEFFGSKNDLLYTQLFTIIKENKNVTLSGESSR